MVSLRIYLIATGAMLFAYRSYAQQDTVFFDKSWKKTESMQGASFFRLSVANGQLYDIKDYYLDGTLQMSGTFSDIEKSTKEGEFIYYNRNGSIASEGVFIENKKEGEWNYYDSLGSRSMILNYDSGKLHGEWSLFYGSGALKRKDIYDKGNVLEGKCFAEDGSEIPYFPYEIMPEFIGGNEAMNAYLASNLKYPKAAVRKSISGKVMVRFLVDEQGNITQVKILKGVHELLDEEALRVVSKMPRWNPGKIDGKPVKYIFQLPVRFEL